MSRILIGIVILATLIGAMGGCAPPPETKITSPSWRPHFRFIERPPTDLFERQEITEEVNVFEWDFSKGGKRPTLEIEGADLESEPSDGGLRLQSSAGAIELTFPLERSAQEVNHLAVEFQGRVPSHIRLSWKAKGKAFAKRRSLSVPSQRARQDGIFRFDLALSEAWEGEIETLRLQIATDGRQRVELHRILGRLASVQADHLTAALSRPWQSALHGEVHNALLGLPGLPVERQVNVPEGGRLQFSFAVPPKVRQAVRFRVFAEAEVEGPVEIFSQEIEPNSPDSQKWHWASLDLAELAGKEVKLRLLTETEEPFDPFLGCPVWGNPEVQVWSTEPRPANVVLISIDTLRADHLSLYGYGRETSPRLDAWARSSGIVFETAVVQSSWTLPSHASLFTGLRALRHGVNHPVRAPERLETLAEILREAGYATMGVAGGSYLHPRFGLSQGFDLYRSTSGTPQVELASGIEQADLWLREQGAERPFFLFFHTYEVHDPFNAREPYFSEFGTWDITPLEDYVVSRPRGGPTKNGFQALKEFQVQSKSGEKRPLTNEELPMVVDLYDSGIAYTDEMLARIFDTLKELGLDEETVVVLTSDHGEALGENGVIGHGSLYDHNLLVPLIFALPGGEGGGRRIQEQVRSVDVVPTLLDLLDLPPLRGLDGVSLVPLMEGRSSKVPREATTYSSLTNYGLSLRVDGRFKYILQNNPWPKEVGEELYRITEDPHEESNLLPGASQVEGLRQKAQEMLRGEVPGLRMRWSNDQPVAWCGTLESSIFGLATVRTMEPDVACRWKGRGRVSCCVDSGDTFTLLVENVTAPQLQLKGRFGPRNDKEKELPFEIGVDLSTLEARHFLSLQDPSGGLQAGEGDGSYLTLWWQGPRDRPAESAPEDDAELRQQLQALGYIDG